MEAGVDTGVSYLHYRGGEGPEAPMDAGQPVGSDGEGRVIAVEGGQHRGGGLLTPESAEGYSWNAGVGSSGDQAASELARIAVTGRQEL